MTIKFIKYPFVVAVIWALTAFASAQTEKRCAPEDTGCQKGEIEKVEKGEGTKASEPLSQNLRLVLNTDDAAIKPAIKDPDYRPKPGPTPTPVEGTAAPAKPASNGTNPAELITRVEVKYQYQNFAFGDIHGIAIVRGDYAFTPTVGIRMDLPILHFNSKTPGLRSESGIGDIVTSMTFVKIFSKRFVGAVVPRIDFPTATHSTLGSGKYSFKPLIAGITPFGPGAGLVGIIEQRVSFAGNRNRADINETAFRVILLKSFLQGPLKGYYANPQLETVVDYEINNRTTTQFAVNMGKVLSKNLVVFVVPTFHVAGTKRENFKLEAGLRYLFR